MKRSIDSVDLLKENWEILLQSLSVEPALGQQVFLDLVAAYSGDGRSYHKLEHIQLVLETIEQIRRGPPPLAAPNLNLPAIQLSAWFHDVIYDSRAKDNEEKSAEYAEATLNFLKIPKSTTAQVKNLIVATKNHQSLSDDINSQVLLDADLAILGSGEAQYQAYAQAIRQEYAWVSDAEYRVGRKQVLQKFLQRKRIYSTHQLFDTLEEKARQNLQAEVAALSSTALMN
jgi:predicted metal-dependent HD superfamily phosphohydrolase